jgi:hypothetical protein
LKTTKLNDNDAENHIQMALICAGSLVSMVLDPGKNWYSNTLELSGGSESNMSYIIPPVCFETLP